MFHQCTVKPKEGSIPELFITGAIFHKLKARLRRFVIVHPDNPRISKYCRSEKALREEKQRQLNSNHPWIIHPMSKLRAWYEMYLILLYTNCLLLKPLDSAFARRNDFFYGYQILSIGLDILSIIDIFANFSTGFCSLKIQRIEMRPGKIAKNYMRSPYFICDVLSSIPKMIPFLILENRQILGLIPLLALFKFIRLFTVIGLINSTSQYFRIKRRGVIFIITSSLVTFLVIHWLSCLQFLIPRLAACYFTSRQKTKSWIFAHGIFQDTLRVRYAHSFFKGSAEILGVRLRMYEINLVEDYIVTILTFVIGRVLLAVLWIVLAMSFLNARSMQIKFVEIMNQLDEYMAQKKIPLDLRKRIIQYYDFKFQRKYFKDAMITNMLSNRLKKEVNIQMCRTLILNVPIFSDLTVEEIGAVVSKLTPEIFLSKDTVIYSGVPSDTLYFISSGTVALYTQSGQEICHLQDGGFFGEICLVTKNYSSQITVIAIEITHIYKLKRNDFNQCFKNYKVVYKNIIKQANARLKAIRKMEQEYQNERMRRELQGAISNVIE